ncbi:MAG: hypothetical protein ACRDPB_01070 [Nocardioidaceae bacterium]
MNTEDLLIDTLRERTERTEYPTTPMATVRSRARAVRVRRRRTTVLAAAAGVAALVVPGAVWLSHSPESSPRPSQVSSSGPSQARTSASPTPHQVRLASIPIGAPPRIAYFGPRGFINEQGQVVTFAHLEQPTNAYVPTSFTPYEGGFLVVGSDGMLHQISSSGRQSIVGCALGDLSVSSDGVTNAWATRATCGARTTTIHRSIPSGVGNGQATQQLPGRLEVVGLLHNSPVISDLWPGRGGAWITDLVHSPRPIPGLASAGGVDESDGLVTGQSASSHGRDGVLVDVSTGAVKWTAPGWQLGRFSADESYVVGYRLVDSGEVTRLGIFNARTGRLLRAVDNLVDGAIANPADTTAWEDDHDLLVLADGVGDQAVVRVPMSGPLTRATPIHQIARPGAHWWAFSARP